MTGHLWVCFQTQAMASYGVQVPLGGLGNSWMMALRVSAVSGCWFWTPEEAEQLLSSNAWRTKCVEWEDAYWYISLWILSSPGFLVFLFPELPLAGELPNMGEKLIIIIVPCLLVRTSEWLCHLSADEWQSWILGENEKVGGWFLRQSSLPCMCVGC